jgi:Flp pilus assembly pilin Flp
MGLHLQKRKDETMMTKKIIAMKNYLRMRNEGLKDFLREEDGVGVVEVILILVVIIGLVLIFKEQLNTLVESLFETINDKAGSV